MAANRARTLAPSRSGVAVRLDLQCLATMLAMDRIRFVPVQAAFRALMLDLGWLEDGTCQLHKWCDTHDHDKHRQQLPAGRRHGDIAEARRRERRHRKIERINVAHDASSFVEGQHEYERRGHEDEHEQVYRG